MTSHVHSTLAKLRFPFLRRLRCHPVLIIVLVLCYSSCSCVCHCACSSSGYFYCACYGYVIFPLFCVLFRSCDCCCIVLVRRCDVARSCLAPCACAFACACMDCEGHRLRFPSFLRVASPFFPGILLSRRPPKSLGKQLVLKRTMVEQNGQGINP